MEAKIIKGKGACILVSSMIALTGCGSDNNSEQPLNSQDNQTTETRTYPHWVPKLTEYYDSEGNLTSCIRAELDSDGFILRVIDLLSEISGVISKSTPANTD